MTGVVLLKATSIAEAIPDRFWLPSPEALAGLKPNAAWVKAEAVEVDDDGSANLAAMTPLWVAVEIVDGDELRGPVVKTQVEHPGFEEGDELAVRFDQVFDITRLDENGSPTLNAERAGHALGKTVLVGITRQAPTGEPRSQDQFAGRLVAVDAQRGLELELSNGETWTMPPDMGPWEVAPPGEYRLRSTGEIVTDPDYLCTWLVTERE